MSQWVQDVNKRQKILRKLQDVDGLYQLVGDAICDFIRAKPAPFPCAFRSKRHFLSYGSWKRAFIFTCFYRFLTNSHANKHWTNYGYHNYKLGKSLFATYCEHDHQILHQTLKFTTLPDDVADVDTKSTKTPKKKKRTRHTFELSSPEGSKGQKPKLICLISSSDDDDD